jgi:hypothetical protein
MALDKVSQRLVRITQTLRDAGVAHALVGGQAVALWVATRDEAAVRTTKDVDILIRRSDLGAARAAAKSIGMEYYELMGVGMFLDPENPSPKQAVHLVWAGERVRPDYVLPSPTIEATQQLSGGQQVVSVRDLAIMKLLANRDHDRAHLHDMIEVGLFGREMLDGLPDQLADRLRPILDAHGQ